MRPVVRLSVVSVVFVVSVAFAEVDYEDDASATSIEADDECLSTDKGACALSALQIRKSAMASSSKSAVNGLVSQGSQSNTKDMGAHCSGGRSCENLPYPFCNSLSWIGCHWVTPAPAPASGADSPIIITLGPSHGNSKCVDRPDGAKCASDAANPGHRVNTDYPDSSDSFKVTVEAGQLCVRRTDSGHSGGEGWWQDLQIRCHVGGSGHSGHGREKVITIGTSNVDRKCVKPPRPVSCPVDAGNLGHKANTDYADANDIFEITVNSEFEICAERVDTKAGWKQALQIRCRE